jgi:D-alanyl-lipoteichoic acid acyltransferase DltB (MBOAT superfamily)
VALNSWQFLAMAALAAIVVPSTSGTWRLVVVLGINACFAWSYWGPTATVAVGVCLLGYAGARAVAGRGPGIAAAVLVALTATFVWLRGYSFETLSAVSALSPSGALAFAGLSFLFFKVVHVVVDSAAGTLGALTPGVFAAYCTNYTTLLMGPLQRYQDFATQWANPSLGQASLEDKLDAVNRVLRGLVKAFAVAPWLQPFVLAPGLNVEALAPLVLLQRAVAFYLYLYLDFSGYCDIVIGAGTLMGVRPPENFDLPFLSRNVSAYWLRVHRSLTMWLTDYVFTPAYRGLLGTGVGTRAPFLALALALMATMLVAGVWHGTTLNFVLFGLVHGVALVAARAYEQLLNTRLGRARARTFSQRPAVTVAATALTFTFTTLAYVLFVLPAGDAWRVYARLAAWAVPGDWR